MQTKQQQREARKARVKRDLRMREISARELRAELEHEKAQQRQHEADAMRAFMRSK